MIYFFSLRYISPYVQEHHPPISIVGKVLLDIRHKGTLGSVKSSKEPAGDLHQRRGYEFRLMDDFDGVLGDDGAVMFEGATTFISVSVDNCILGETQDKKKKKGGGGGVGGKRKKPTGKYKTPSSSTSPATYRYPSPNPTSHPP